MAVGLLRPVAVRGCRRGHGGRSRGGGGRLHRPGIASGTPVPDALTDGGAGTPEPADRVTGPLGDVRAVGPARVGAGPPALLALQPRSGLRLREVMRPDLPDALARAGRCLLPLDAGAASSAAGTRRAVRSDLLEDMAAIDCRTRHDQDADEDRQCKTHWWPPFLARQPRADRSRERLA